MIELAEIEAARERIAGRRRCARRWSGCTSSDAPAEIYLKLETLQPINSFKIRGAANAVRMRRRRQTRCRGLVTASAGNMAQGVAWVARELGVPATIAVPEHAPEAKLAAIERLGGRVLKLPYDEWWQAIVTSAGRGSRGAVRASGAGRGGDGRQRHDRARDPRGPARSRRGRDPLRRRRADGRDRQRDQGAPAARPRSTPPSPRPAPRWSRRYAAGGPADVDYQPSFVDGSGSRRVLDSMWPRVAPLIDDAFAVPIGDAAAAVRTLAERVRVIAEGAGALATAAALAGRAGAGKVVCVVSGGNINLGEAG